MYVSIDVGGTNTRVAVFEDLYSATLATDPIEQKNTGDFNEDINFIIACAQKLSGSKRIRAVGICSPGTQNPEKTELVSAKNLTSWIGKPAVKSLSTALKCDVYYDNDAVAAGIGEYRYGKNLGGAFHYLIWGTGIGGVSIESTNKGVQSKKLNWLENFKAWESDCGGSELELEFGKKPENFVEKEWRVVESRTIKHLRDYIQINQPGTIIFGGGLAVRHSEFLQRIGAINSTRVRATEFGGNSGLIGALGLIPRSNLPT